MEGGRAGADHGDDFGVVVEQYGGDWAELIDEGDDDGGFAKRVGKARESKDGDGLARRDVAPGKDGDRAGTEGENFGVRQSDGGAAGKPLAEDANQWGCGPGDCVAPVEREQLAVAQSAGEEEQPVGGDHGVQALFGIELVHGGAVFVDDVGTGNKDGRPTLLPGAHANVEILNVGGLVGFVNTIQLGQAAGIVHAATAAAVEDVGEVLRFDGVFATYRKIGGRGIGGEKRLAGLLAGQAGGEEDLRGGAEEIGNTVKGVAQAAQEIRREHHVVIQQADMRETGGAQANVDGDGEQQGLGAFDDRHTGEAGGEHSGGAIAGAVIDDDDFADADLLDDGGQHLIEHFAAVAGRDDDGDSGGARRAGDRRDRTGGGGARLGEADDETGGARPESE